MGEYSVPAEIRALKPKGTIVKRIKGNYYVYSHSQSKDPATGRWKTAPGALMGKIVPGVGYCPKGERASSGGRITCFDYGEYLLACGVARAELDALKKVFNPDEAMQVFFAAARFALGGFSGIKALECDFERSLIARDYPALPFSYHRLSALLERTGRTQKQADYQRELARGSGEAIAIDGHAIATASERNCLSAAGWKTASLGSEYMNLMVALDVESLQPIATKAFPGYLPDKSDFRAFCADMGDLRGKVLLVDMGFFSRSNVELVESWGAFYVIPVSANRSEHKALSAGRRGRPSQFLYRRGGKTDPVEYREERIGGRRFIRFRNLAEAGRLSAAYLEAAEAGKKGFSSEGYARMAPDFGAIVLETNLGKSAEEVYSLYKSRWSIETYYDRLKNGIGFEALNLDDYAVAQGLAFVMMVAGRIDARIAWAARKAGMSRKELIQLMRFLKLVDDGKRVSILNVKKQHSEVLAKLGIAMSVTAKCLG